MRGLKLTNKKSIRKTHGFMDSSNFYKSIMVFPLQDRKKLGLVLLLQVSLNLLDLVGVASFGLLGALAVRGVQSKQPGNKVTFVLDFLHIQSQSFQLQAAILGVFAAFVLVGRTILSIIFTRRMFKFLSRRAAYISSGLVSRLLSQPLTKLQKRSTQETIYAAGYGVTSIALGVVGTAIAISADAFLMLIMMVGLFVIDSTIAVGVFFFFGFIGWLMYWLMNVRAKELGTRNWELSVQADERIAEALNSYRELLTSNRRDYYARQISKSRTSLAEVLAEIQFLPNISKYVIESSVILGALLISATQFLLNDATHAAASLAVFLAAGTRIAPAVLRIQQGSIQIRNALGQAVPTLDLLGQLKGRPVLQPTEDLLDVIHNGFKGVVNVSNLTLKYENSEKAALSNINLKISEGEVCAVVGPTGAGKTSLVDVILGIIDPTEGSVTVSGLEPKHAIEEWPGAISYVPQEVAIVNATVRENIGLGYPSFLVTDEYVNSALQTAHLFDFVANLPNGLDSALGERGRKISGGQRQRLGIARAMFTKPLLLVLDEATSSLDGKTEADIAEAISNLKGSTTIIVIAHRLSTIRTADVIAYMENGRIIATGSFDEVRNAVPNFDSQAKLMGL